MKHTQAAIAATDWTEDRPARTDACRQCGSLTNHTTTCVQSLHGQEKAA